MLHPSHRRPVRQALTLTGVMSLGLLAAWALPGWSGFGKLEHYVPVHTIMEILSVVVAVLVFASGWNAFSRALPRNALILSCAFLGVAILDFSHALSYAGMPDYVTPSSPQKAINFWLAARLLAALALLAVAVLPAVQVTSVRTRYGWLLGVLAGTAAVHDVFFYHPEWMPATYVAGTGLTPFKVAAEYVIIAMLLASAAMLWRKMRTPQSFNAGALFGAACIMALSECFFTLYVRVNDFYNLMGHLYKVVAYGFLYRAVFVQVIESPYRELAEMRDRLRAMLDAVPDVMLELDLDGRYHAVHSSRPEALLRPPQELLGRTVFDVLPPEQAMAVISALKDAMLNGMSVGMQLELPLPDRRRWFELSVARKGQPAGTETRFIVISRDITERKQVEAAMLQQEAAQQASKAKSEFLSRVSHELRTPLNAVIGFSQLLMQGGSSQGMAPTQRQHAQYILRAGQHLLDMINDILDLTRIESGQADLLIEPVAVSHLMEEVLPMVSGQADKTGVRLDAGGVGDVPWRILGDRRRLRQVLINVLSNAIKYNRAGGRVVVRAAPCAQHPDMLSLTIADTGRGLTAEQLSNLFEPFNRLGADQEGIEGTGLGLVITRRLVESMNGDIRFESTPDVGTVVTLTFPKVASATDSPPFAPGAASLGGRPAASSHEPAAMVLCVEDNPINAALLQAILEMRPGIELVVVDSGEAALEQAKARAPDLMLIDLNLPGMQGTELLRQIRQLPACADVTCIAMSADVFGDPLGRARKAGFTDFWPKPLDVAGVLERLDAAIGLLDRRQGRLWAPANPATDAAEA
ncbi:MAG: MASE3 domain-containing protein [Aquabacterium sp.]